MKEFGLRYPIIQAPMDGPATARLATAVVNAGALGSLPLTWVPTSEAVANVRSVVDNTSKPRSLFANYVLNFPVRSLDQTIAEGLSAVQFSWGLPDPGLVGHLRNHSVRIGIQVTGGENARRAMDLGPDFLVCQGTAAGGHVQAYQPLAGALDEVLAVAGDVPVAASGGMSTGDDIRRWISAGAAAAVLGTRFVATVESAAHQLYKQMLIDASAEDTVLTVCLNKVWPNATHRILRNSTFDMWEAAGCPQAPDRPGEIDVVARERDLSEFIRYQGNVAVETMTGDVTALGVYAGEGVTRIRDTPTVADLVDRLWAEFCRPGAGRAAGAQPNRRRTTNREIEQ